MILLDEQNTMSTRPLIKRTLDEIYEQVLDNLKRSGLFDEMRVDLITPMWEATDFQENIVGDFKRQFKDFCSKCDLSQDRKDLRAALDKHAEDGILSNRMLRYCIETEIDTKMSEIKTKFTQHVEDYLRKEFQKQVIEVPEEPPGTSEPEPSLPNLEVVDMDIDPESPEAPPFSPISENGDLTFSSVSSVRTAELSDFEDSINLSDDEANIVGHSRIKIDELQGTIDGLQTKAIKNEQIDTHDPTNKSLCETSESDACSENATMCERRATRKRKSNPRYCNEQFTS